MIGSGAAITTQQVTTKVTDHAFIEILGLDKILREVRACLIRINVTEQTKRAK